MGTQSRARARKPAALRTLALLRMLGNACALMDGVAPVCTCVCVPAAHQQRRPGGHCHFAQEVGAGRGAGGRGGEGCVCALVRACVHGTHARTHACPPAWRALLPHAPPSHAHAPPVRAQAGGYRPPPDLRTLLDQITSPDWYQRMALPANLETLKV